MPAPVTGYNETPLPPYLAAQATLDYGQSQMKELDHQATVVGLEMAQAAQAAEQSTLESNQRQMMELAYQATAVSLNMAQAAATQQFIIDQTQMVWNGTANAQSQAATATYSTYIQKSLRPHKSKRFWTSKRRRLPRRMLPRSSSSQNKIR